MRHALVLVSLLAGCSEQVNVSVNCEAVAEPAVECVAKQTQGTSEIDVCWDFEVTCANGAVVKSSNMCTKVKDGGSSTVKAGKDKLVGIDKCGGGGKPTAKLLNMTINGKPSQL